MTDHFWLPLKVSIGFGVIVRRQKLSNQPRFLCKFHLRWHRLLATAASKRSRRLRTAGCLIIAEELENPDGSVKAWVLDDGQFTELSYLPAKGFRVTDCAALNNGDVLVLERRYVPFGILSARLTRVKAGGLRPGAKLAGKELLKLEQPLAVENFEGIAVQQTSEWNDDLLSYLTITTAVSSKLYFYSFLLPDSDP